MSKDNEKRQKEMSKVFYYKTKMEEIQVIFYLGKEEFHPPFQII